MLCWFGWLSVHLRLVRMLCHIYQISCTYTEQHWTALTDCKARTKSNDKIDKREAEETKRGSEKAYIEWKSNKTVYGWDEGEGERQ